MDFLDVMLESILTEVTAEEKYTKQYTDKAEKKGYKKAGHPELKLDSVNRYLDKVLS